MFFDEWLKQRAYCKISEIAKPIIKNFQNASRSEWHLFSGYAHQMGSCTIKNKLIFNPKLIHTPKRCIEYVIMHELCHTVHKHHNQDFFDLLTLMMPDWEKRKEKLDSFAWLQRFYLLLFIHNMNNKPYFTERWRSNIRFAYSSFSSFV